jgi:O-antigen ligase
VLIAAQGYIILRPLSSTQPPAGLLNERDSDSLSVRFDIWASALAITRAYPLTGVGANMYRDGRVRALFPVPTFSNGMPPHAHNAWLQMSADMGLPGLAIYIGIQITLAFMLVRTWQRGDKGLKAIALGVGGGLLAHTIYSVGDAIPLWDRLAFVYWLLAGLAGASYSLITETGLPVRKP